MACRICKKNNLEAVIDLGRQPWCNHFLSKDEIGKEPFYPLRVVYCLDCRTTQLDFTVKKEVMFGNHTYLSGVTKSLSDHFKMIANNINDLFPQKNKKLILDIGSNDGTQLKHYKDLGWDVLGVESSKITADIANKNGIKTVNAFFNKDLALKLNKQFKIINASGVFFHLEELHSVTEGIKILLDTDGVFVIQFLYLKSIIENNAFDQIYHEHLLYYTLDSLQNLLSQYDLDIFDAYLTPIHGGQMIVYASHPDQYNKTDRLKTLEYEEEASGCNQIGSLVDFSKRIEQMRDENLVFLNSLKKQKKTVFGMGAPVKGNTLLNYFKIGPELIPFLLEKNPLRKDLFSPGMHIPIKMEDEMHQVPDVYYVLAWNFKKEILQNNQHLVDKGIEFYFPIDVG
jgi:SAM-dependent methyltransferase